MKKTVLEETNSVTSEFSSTSEQINKDIENINYLRQNDIKQKCENPSKFQSRNVMKQNKTSEIQRPSTSHNRSEKLNEYMKLKMNKYTSFQKFTQRPRKRLKLKDNFITRKKMFVKTNCKQKRRLSLEPIPEKEIINQQGNNIEIKDQTKKPSSQSCSRRKQSAHVKIHKSHSKRASSSKSGTRKQKKLENNYSAYQEYFIK